MFTDREREMADLMKWVNRVGKKAGRSRALVSHRRYGKTALMERLYNRLFWERKDIMPFYFELHDGIHKIWDKELAKIYFYAFVRQFLAYRTRDASLAFSQNIPQKQLFDIAERHQETSITQRILWWEEDGNMSDFIKIHEVMHTVIHNVAVETGLSIIVMFDEFQRLNRVVYQDEACTRPYERYTDSFSTAAESSRAPMLIWCDLVWEHGDQQYGGLSDPLLADVLRIDYSWEIDQIKRQQAVENAQAKWVGKSAAYYEEIIDTLRSELNYWVGHVGEVFIKKFMAHHFKDQVVEGADTFNQPRDIQLTRFTRLYSTSIQPYGAPSSSQIDIYAIPANADHLPWVVEVKNWQSPVSRPTVVHFWEAAQNLAEEKGHMQGGEMAMVCWFHARSGFTGPARDFLKEKGILYTDGEALTKMLRTFEVIEKWREHES